MRQTVQKAIKAGVKGIKIQVSGRLNGADIARAEEVREGPVPLQTLRADIDYAQIGKNNLLVFLGRVSDKIPMVSFQWTKNDNFTYVSNIQLQFLRHKPS